VESVHRVGRWDALILPRRTFKPVQVGHWERRPHANGTWVSSMQQAIPVGCGAGMKVVPKTWSWPPVAQDDIGRTRVASLTSHNLRGGTNLSTDGPDENGQWLAEQALGRVSTRPLPRATIGGVVQGSFRRPDWQRVLSTKRDRESATADDAPRRSRAGRSVHGAVRIPIRPAGIWWGGAPRRRPAPIWAGLTALMNPVPRRRMADCWWTFNPRYYRVAKRRRTRPGVQRRDPRWDARCFDVRGQPATTWATGLGAPETRQNKLARDCLGHPEGEWHPDDRRWTVVASAGVTVPSRGVLRKLGWRKGVGSSVEIRGGLLGYSCRRVEAAPGPKTHVC